MDTSSIMAGAGAPKTVRFFRLLARWSLYLSFFLVPLTFSPWTTEIFEINKQMVFVLLTAVGVMSWLGSMVIGRELSFRARWINGVVLALLGGIALSALFSMANYQTWVGQLSQEYTSFITLTGLILMFFLLMNTAADKAQQINLLRALFWAAAISGLLTALGMLNIFHLPFTFAEGAGFNPVGTINSFAAFLTVLMFIGLAMWVFNDPQRNDILPAGWIGRACRILIGFIILITLLVLAAIDYWVFWAITLGGIAIITVFHFVRARGLPNPKPFILPLIVLVVALTLLFAKTPLNLKLPVIVTPTFGVSMDITQKTLSYSWKNLLLGSGPGTFIYNYDQFKPAAINQTMFWNLRFDRAKANALTMLATMGIVNSLLVLVLFGCLTLQALSRLLFERDHEEWKMTLVLFTGFAVTALFQIFYATNLTLHFLFWALAGLLSAQVFTRVWKKKFADAPRLSLAMSFLFVLLMIGVLAGVFVSERRFEAETAFARAVKLDQQQAPLPEIIRELMVATQKNSWSDIYFRNLSSALLLQAGEVVAAAKGAALTEEQTKQVAALVQAGLGAATNATSLEPNNVANWAAQGAIYRDLMPYVDNADSYAAATFARAIGLEPANPVHYANLGRIHLQVAANLAALQQNKDEKIRAEAASAAAQQLGLAEQAFQNAVTLKPDYAPAHYYLAMIFERQGRIQAAAERLAALIQANPTNVGLRFELGIMQLSLQDLDGAKESLEKALELKPDYSNAMWFLASVYELKKDPANALALVQKVAELNPENELAQKRLARLQAGELTTVVEQPLEEGEVAAAKAEGAPVTTEDQAAAEIPLPEEEKPTTF